MRIAVLMLAWLVVQLGFLLCDLADLCLGIGRIFIKAGGACNRAANALNSIE